MEWLEFSRWSPEVERQLAQQAARIGAVAERRASLTRRVRAGATTVSSVYRLTAMLREYPRTNPWGHPATES
ncbi:hypothetical protein LZ198_11910 [Myxococcus sp. K15C18031901]|uniref:hypothetical protein n=1 Tax=Myxococcus dinghuensis TaxID=2906761 RepID=UPI0020A740AD|nr:hypothetical protein [Myxococcus dinghuensis]MCP3099572.1 hypothetical protein [Myxococcus dinghuensis]